MVVAKDTERRVTLSQFIVKLAHEMNVKVIPYGGGTTVTESLECDSGETRFILSMDMKMMNAIKWIDRESMMACIEAGATGKDLDARLAMMGFVEHCDAVCSRSWGEPLLCCNVRFLEGG